ncbi:MAG: hypothetical protein ACP5IV_08015 [Caldisericia bacterium]
MIFSAEAVKDTLKATIKYVLLFIIVSGLLFTAYSFLTNRNLSLSNEYGTCNIQNSEIVSFSVSNNTFYFITSNPSIERNYTIFIENLIFGQNNVGSFTNYSANIQTLTSYKYVDAIKISPNTYKINLPTNATIVNIYGFRYVNGIKEYNTKIGTCYLNFP